MNYESEQKIITPRSTELISNNESNIESQKADNSQVYAEIYSNNISKSRLTCCCEYKKYIICAGFSGELFFVDRNSLIVDHKEKISNNIIRCLRVIYSEEIILVSTDAGEVITYDLKCKSKQYYEHSKTPIYNIVLKDSRVFITSERNGDIFEWEYITGTGIFRNKKLFSVENAAFAMNIIKGKLVVVNSIGNKFEYDFLKSKVIRTNLCQTNAFCVKEGKDEAVFYGLSTGAILYEEIGCEICPLESHQDAVRDLIFSPKKKWMFSVSKDRTVKAWHNNIPRVITQVMDYLYQIVFVEENSCLYYVDGHGDIGCVRFLSDIDHADSICIKNKLRRSHMQVVYLNNFYEKEEAELRSRGISCERVNYPIKDSFMFEILGHPIFRGPKMNAEEYSKFIQELNRNNCAALVSLEDYKKVADAMKYTKCFGKYAPKVKTFDINENQTNISYQLSESNMKFPLFVRSDIESAAKYVGVDACVLKSADVNAIKEVIKPIVEHIANPSTIIMKEIVPVKKINGKTVEYRAIVVDGKIVCFDYDTNGELPHPKTLSCAWQFEDCINIASKNGLNGAYFVDFGVDESENIFVVECKNIINGTIKNIGEFAIGLAKMEKR